MTLDNDDANYRLVRKPEDVREGEEVKNILTMTDREFEAYLELLAQEHKKT